MTAAQSLDEVVAVLSRTARWVAGSDGIAVVLRQGECCAYVAEDAIEPLWKGRRFPLNDCVSGWAMLHDETVIVPDIGRDPRVPLAAYMSKAVRSLVMVPIGKPAPVAALGAYWCAMVLLDTETVSRLERLASQAGAAIARVQACADVKRVAS